MMTHPDRRARSAASPAASAPEAQPARRRRVLPRFSVAAILLLMLVACVVAAAGSYMRTSLQAGTPARAFFVIFTLASPVVLLAVMSVFHGITRWVDRAKRRRR